MPTTDTERELGIVDAMVRSSFLVGAILTEAAAEAELSLTQLRLLGILRDREARMAQLAELLGLTKQSMTGLVDRAERRDLLTRVSRPGGDERAVYVTLTPRGRELAAAVVERVTDRIGALTADLTASQRSRLATLLGEVVLGDDRRRGFGLGHAGPARTDHTSTDERSRA